MPAQCGVADGDRRGEGRDGKGQASRIGPEPVFRRHDQQYREPGQSDSGQGEQEIGAGCATCHPLRFPSFVVGGPDLDVRSTGCGPGFQRSR